MGNGASCLKGLCVNGACSSMTGNISVAAVVKLPLSVSLSETCASVQSVFAEAFAAPPFLGGRTWRSPEEHQIYLFTAVIMGIILLCDYMAEIIFVLVIASCHSAPSQRQCSCTIKATTKERLLSLRRRWWNTTRQTWTVGRCAKARRSLRAKTTSDTATASMKSYQVRNRSRGALSRRRLGSSLPCDLCFALPLFTAIQ